MNINPSTSGPAVSTLEDKNLGFTAELIGQVSDFVPQPKMRSIFDALAIKGIETVGEQNFPQVVSRLWN